MKTQVVIRYKWKERGEEKWLFWLEKKVQKLGLETIMLPISDQDFLKDPAWLKRVQESHGIDEKDTFIISHDPGCLTILKYIERLVMKGQESPALLVAGINLRHAPVSEKKDIVLRTRGARPERQDVRLVVVYGGSLGKALKDPAQGLPRLGV